MGSPTHARRNPPFMNDYVFYAVLMAVFYRVSHGLNKKMLDASQLFSDVKVSYYAIKHGSTYPSNINLCPNTLHRHVYNSITVRRQRSRPLCIPPLTGKPEEQRLTIRSGVLTGTSSRRRGAALSPDMTGHVYVTVHLQKTDC